MVNYVTIRKDDVINVMSCQVSWQLRHFHEASGCRDAGRQALAVFLEGILICLFFEKHPQLNLSSCFQQQMENTLRARGEHQSHWSAQCEKKLVSFSGRKCERYLFTCVKTLTYAKLVSVAQINQSCNNLGANINI